MILLFLVFFLNIISIQSKSHEIPSTHSNEFLKSAIFGRRKYEESRETVEANRETCLDEYREKEKLNNRRNPLSPFCVQYCNGTKNCQENDESSACLHPGWPSRSRRHVAKFQRTCYIRISDVLRYEQAESLCQKFGLRLAIIDNGPLLERLKQMNMFNISCRGQCPTARGYFIGLKRLLNESDETESKWVWSNNFTWTQGGIECDNESYAEYPNATLLCYIDSNGQKKLTVWNENEPNNHPSGIFNAGEECVEIIVNNNQGSYLAQVAKLNDIPCTKPTLGTICQMEDLKPIDPERFKLFATIVSFNQTEVDQNNALDNLLSKFGGPIAANLEALGAILEALESLLTLPAFTLEQSTMVLNVVDQVVDVTGKVEAEPDSLKTLTNKLLHFLDLFPVKIQTGNDGNASFEYENMNMSIVDIDFEQKNTEWFTMKDATNPDAIIELNMRVLQKQLNESNSSRIIETIFSNFNLFPQVNTTLLGIPISYQIANTSTVHTEEDLIRFRIRIADTSTLQNIHCAYWSFDELNGTWVTDQTCRLTGYIDNYVQCSCNHLTHFALLILPESKSKIGPLSTIEELILTFVTYIGICLSILGLLLTLITYSIFGRANRNHLHGSLIMLCFALLFVNNFFIPFTFVQSKITNLKQAIACTVIAYFFHYLLIASFIWMLIIAIVQYMHFVRIFNSHISHFFTKTCLIGWMIPLIFPTIVVLFGSNGGYASESRCWINNSILLYVTFIIPLSMILITNLILFGFILKSIYHRGTVVVSHQRIHSKIQMGAALCCFVSMGCTWIFAWLVLLHPNFLHQLIFCVSNSSQGFLIFLFHVYLSKPKREFWQIFCFSKDGSTVLNTISGGKSSTTDPTKNSST